MVFPRARHVLTARVVRVPFACRASHLSSRNQATDSPRPALSLEASRKHAWHPSATTQEISPALPLLPPLTATRPLARGFSIPRAATRAWPHAHGHTRMATRAARDPSHARARTHASPPATRERPTAPSTQRGDGGVRDSQRPEGQRVRGSEGRLRGQRSRCLRW